MKEKHVSHRIRFPEKVKNKMQALALRNRRPFNSEVIVACEERLKKEGIM